MSSSDRALLNAIREINNMADRINLPKTIVDRANTLFKQVHDGKNLKGRANDAIASACLYIACRQEGVPRTFKEICAVSKISKKEIGRCFKLILKALETSVDLITTGDFMSRFCSNLGLPNMVQRAATHIARKAVEIDIVPGRSPISVAAAAIYMASQVWKIVVLCFCDDRHLFVFVFLFFYSHAIFYFGFCFVMYRRQKTRDLRRRSAISPVSRTSRSDSRTSWCIRTRASSSRKTLDSLRRSTSCRKCKAKRKFFFCFPLFLLHL